MARDFTRVSGFPQFAGAVTTCTSLITAPLHGWRRNRILITTLDDSKSNRALVNWSGKWLLHCLEGSDLDASDVLMVRRHDGLGKGVYKVSSELR